MQPKEQGVLQKITPLAEWWLSLTAIVLCMAMNGATLAASPDEPETFPIHFLYDADSRLQKNIVERIKHGLAGRTGKHAHPWPSAKTLFVILDPAQSGQYITNHKTSLIITTSPDENLPGSQSSRYLFMTQPYCRQLRLIRRTSNKIHTVGYLKTRQSKILESRLQACARDNQLELFEVEIKTGDSLSERVKTALKHSDALLAMPDKHIYNRKTVKNILLTSYRFRKPVFAFSKNFVTAGALAAVHSSVDQIADSAVKLIVQLLAGENVPPFNYPERFEVSLNKQVFNALGLSWPGQESLPPYTDLTATDENPVEKEQP